MKFRFSIALLAVVLAACGCHRPAAPAAAPHQTFAPGEPTEAQPRLNTVELWLGPAQLESEVAITGKQIQTGMMFRKEMAETNGMIFILPYPQRAAFWMKNCFVPLSVAYINSEGVIKEIHDLQPQNTNSVFSATEDIRFALETPQGWFGRHDVQPGMTVRTERGTLLETFGGPR
jgi:uncharacterized membrane protein (UPF0127 family)